MIMKNIVKNILLGTSFTVILASCNLDLEPKTSIAYTPGEPVIVTANDLTQFTNGVLTTFRSYQSGFFNELDDLMCDGFNASSDYGNNYGPIHRTDNSFNSSDQDIDSYYGSYYIAINRYNNFIDQVNLIASPTLKAEATTAKGYAFLYRAFTYLQLVRHFAKDYDPTTAETDLGLPIVLHDDMDYRPSRSSVADTYAQIKKDLDSAAVILADVPGAPAASLPTIDAVDALYARYYLDVEDYENAALKAGGLVDSELYLLANNDAQFTAEYTNDTGTEAILQLYASKDEAPRAYDCYTRLVTVDNADAYAPYFFPSRKLVEAYDEDDLRLANWFSFGDVPVFTSSILYNDEDLAVFVKWAGNPAYTSSGKPSGSNAIKPFRIGEMYLIAAEALYKSGDLEGAAYYLNALQTARGANITAPSNATIQNEWFKETVGEGLRMSCLKRWNVGFSSRLGQNCSAADYVLSHGESFENKSMEASDYHFVWPIPSYERRLNDNLIQNPGYSAVVE